MFPKMTKRVKGLGGFGLLGLLLVVGGLYLYHQHTDETVQERIYVVPERSESPAVQPEPAFQTVPAHTPITSAAAVSYDEVLSAADDHDYESDVFSDGGDVFLTEISEDPVLSESTFDAEEVRIAEIGLQIEKLTEAHYEKYPELLEFANLSRAEIEALSPLERSELGKIGREAQREFLREFRGLFLQMPSAVRADALVQAHDHFTGHLGRETADIIMKEVRSLLGE